MRASVVAVSTTDGGLRNENDIDDDDGANKEVVGARRRRDISSLPHLPYDGDGAQLQHAAELNYD